MKLSMVVAAVVALAAHVQGEQIGGLKRPDTKGFCCPYSVPTDKYNKPLWGWFAIENVKKLGGEIGVVLECHYDSGWYVDVCEFTLADNVPPGFPRGSLGAGTFLPPTCPTMARNATEEELKNGCSGPFRGPRGPWTLSPATTQ